MSLILKNPHSVLAAIRKRPRSVTRVVLASARPAGAWAEVLEAAKAERILIEVGAERPHGGRRPSEKEGRQGTNEATVSPALPVGLDELFGEVDPNRFDLWLALDQVQDPHNLGAIFRTAAFFGVRGLIVTRDRSAPLSAVVYDTASGGVDAVPFANPANLRSGLSDAKRAGLWILGSDEATDRDVFEIPRDRPWLLVLGNEASGMRRLTGETCDDVCRLTPRGEVGSLNVSVAAGAMIAALRRPL